MVTSFTNLNYLGPGGASGYDSSRNGSNVRNPYGNVHLKWLPLIFPPRPSCYQEIYALLHLMHLHHSCLLKSFNYFGKSTMDAIFRVFLLFTRSSEGSVDMDWPLFNSLWTMINVNQGANNSKVGMTQLRALVNLSTVHMNGKKQGKVTN